MRKALPSSAPWWVKLTLFGVETRTAARAYAFASLLLAILLCAVALQPQTRQWIEQRVHLAPWHLLLIAAIAVTGAIHYRQSVRWGDQNGGWKP